MKLSSNAKRCGLSPMRKFHPLAVAARARGCKIYHLNIGQPDIETPEAYFEAAKAFREQNRVLAYAPSPGVPALVSAVQGYYKGIGVDYDESEIFITNGGSEALQILMLSILDPGSEVIIPEPFYPNYSTFVKSAGGVIRPLPTCAEEGYRYAVRERILPLINENTRAIVVTNPGNPTGTVLTREELRMIAEIAKENDLYIICDEVYREFVYGGEPLLSIGQMPEFDENAVIVDSASKRFSACGARIGILISRNKPLLEQVMKFCQGRLASPTLDQTCAAALYGVEGDYFAAVREEYKRRRDVCFEGIKKIPGVVCELPHGAFYLMAKLPVDDADKFQTWLLNEFEDNGETVMFAPGEGFYETEGGGKNEIRIAYVLKEDDLRRAMELLKLGLERYNAIHA